jgi:hypothetical protein
MRVHVIHRLPGVTAGIEDHPVAALCDALGPRYLMSLTHHFSKQPGSGRGQRTEIAIVIPRNHQHVNRSLRIDITKCERARGFEDSRRRNFAHGDSAE